MGQGPGSRGQRKVAAEMGPSDRSQEFKVRAQRTRDGEKDNFVRHLVIPDIAYLVL